MARVPSTFVGVRAYHHISTNGKTDLVPKTLEIWLFRGKSILSLVSGLLGL